MNLHVGNIPLELTQQELTKLFEQYGAVEAVDIITNIRTHEPLGYAFVVMRTDEDGSKAIESLNGATLKDKVITVAPAKNQTGRKRGSSRFPRRH